jgi:hypothetical protein
MALEKDHAFLLKNEVLALDLDLRPHPWEFALYYDI